MEFDLKDYVILIPAYKPVYDQMVPFVTELLSSFDKIVCVDDGGGEQFRDVFAECERLGCHILTHEVNRGKGAALRTGLSYIEKELNTAGGVVTADCDGQHTVSDIKKVAEALYGHPGDMIIGGRKFDKNVPFRSKAGNTFTRLLYKLATGMGVSPYEVTIATIYINDNKGSHFNAMRDGLRIGARILKYTAGSILSFLLDWIIFILLMKLAFSGAGENIRYALSFGIARVVSSVFNYTYNRLAVFGGKNYEKGATLKYFALVITVLALGMLVQRLTAYIPGGDLVHSVIKLAYDAMMFVVNYIIQRDFVFKIKKRKTQ